MLPLAFHAESWPCLQDKIKYGDGNQIIDGCHTDLQGVWVRMAIIRFVFMVPAILIYLGLTWSRWFNNSFRFAAYS